MNVERMKQLRDTLVANESRFNYFNWVITENGRTFTLDQLDDGIVSDCGTCACIGGWACFLWTEEALAFDGYTQATANLLGLTEEVAAWLVWPYSRHPGPGVFPVFDLHRLPLALAKIDHLIKEHEDAKH